MSSERTFSQVFLIFCSIYCCFYLGSVNSEDLFVEEAGETDFIPIESEPEIRAKRESQADYNYSYTNDYDENTQGKNNHQLHMNLSKVEKSLVFNFMVFLPCCFFLMPD